MKLLIFLSFAITTIFSTPYNISSIKNNIVLLNNEAAFSLSGNLNFLSWKDDDEITIKSCPTNSFYVTKYHNGFGYPYLILKNSTQQNESFATFLDSPQTPLFGTYTINEINFITHTIQLNDYSSWNFSSEDYVFINSWNVGDQVMIGENSNKCSLYFDQILFNMTNSTVLSVHSIQP